MRIEVSAAELEILEVSVEIRLQTWRRTLEYLETGVTDGLIAECHQAGEGEWQVARYELLLKRLLKARNESLIDGT